MPGFASHGGYWAWVKFNNDWLRLTKKPLLTNETCHYGALFCLVRFSSPRVPSHQKVKELWSLIGEHLSYTFIRTIRDTWQQRHLCSICETGEYTTQSKRRWIKQKCSALKVARACWDFSIDEVLERAPRWCFIYFWVGLHSWTLEWEHNFEVYRRSRHHRVVLLKACRCAQTLQGGIGRGSFYMASCWTLPRVAHE